MQANRDVTRMEIFLSLMRLLEPSCDGSGAGENPNNNTKMPLGIVRYPVIPATGHLRWASKRKDHRSHLWNAKSGGRPTSAMTSIVNPGRAGISWRHPVHRPCSVHSESLTVDGNGDMDSWFGGWSLEDRCFDCIILVSVCCWCLCLLFFCILVNFVMFCCWMEILSWIVGLVLVLTRSRSSLFYQVFLCDY